MKTRDELLREHTKWTINYVKADQYLKSLLPPVADLSKGEKLQAFVLTEESLAEFERAEKEVETALTKLREILDKLWELQEQNKD